MSGHGRRLLDLPDMIHIGDGQYTPLALNDILLPLDELIEGPNGIDLDTYRLPVYRGVQNDIMYQLAWGVSTPIFYYQQGSAGCGGARGRSRDVGRVLRRLSACDSRGESGHRAVCL